MSTREELGQIVIRPPEGMRERIKAAADRNRRSMNAEIVLALDEKYPPPSVSWHPIETAPKDETRILAMNDEVAFCVWWAGDWNGWVDDGGSSQPYDFTHWMPLPSTQLPKEGC